MAWLVWLRSQTGTPYAQIWRDWESAKGHYHPHQPRGQRHELYITQFELKPGEEYLSVDELAKRYPAPK